MFYYFSRYFKEMLQQLKLFLESFRKAHRRSVIEAKEAIAYPVFGHAVEL